ncbi:MoxR family ATPase [Alloalcanivorax xenomutans]|nr:MULTISPECIES: MoxR family ATPase [Alloalcanivorax]MCE7509887.1 MoxR family ATPase [Alloalcanivorax xenomutans]MCE7524062.1 MoxR family ATPase [Alloalcanivorax xenomutans]WOA30773.1 MoxR family ATPase [Alloalcanivorax xenomutans]WOD27766.1 MoxR family ATPase [Alloalcanivorax xenomutans]CUR46082.1 carbon monoxide dehydrogenase D protein [Alloalcanivorax xenomutans]
MDNREQTLMKTRIDSVDDVIASFARQGYICDQRTALAVYLAAQLQKPILVEGPPGVGKTELAKSAAAFLEAPLIRLQCYEGLDESRALYEWKYGKQLLYTQLLRDKLSSLLSDTENLEQGMARLGDLGDAFYSDTFLEPRPLLRALRAEEPVVLLIDEIDKADQEFEAFLLELLSDFQISIPELGTVRARHRPLVFLTSNDQRELSDALKRRCLHLYIPYPEPDLERRIVAERVPELGDRLREQLVSFIQHLREQDMKKLPAISETLDWARALVLLHADSLEPELVEQTLTLILKNEQDVTLARGLLPHWFSKQRAG